MKLPTTIRLVVVQFFSILLNMLDLSFSPNTLEEFFPWFKITSERFWAQKQLDPSIYGLQIQPGTRWLPGLTEDEITRFERALGFSFPAIYKLFLAHMNGTDQMAVNVYGEEGHSYTYAHAYYSYPRDIDIIKDYINWIYSEYDVTEEIVKQQLIPHIIPIVGHRFLVADQCETHPILSMYGRDTIIYAHSLETFLVNDVFKNHRFEVNNKPIKVRFWVDNGDKTQQHAYCEAGHAVMSYLVRYMGVANSLFRFPVQKEDQLHLAVSFEMLSLENKYNWQKQTHSLRDFTIIPLILLAGTIAEQNIVNPDEKKLDLSLPLVQDALNLCAGYFYEYNEDLSEGDAQGYALQSLLMISEVAATQMIAYWDAVDRVAKSLIENKTLSERQVFGIVNNIQPVPPPKIEIAVFDNAIHFQTPKILIEGRAFYSETVPYRVILTESGDSKYANEFQSIARSYQGGRVKVFYQMPEGSKVWTSGNIYLTLRDAVKGVEIATNKTIQWEFNQELLKIINEPESQRPYPVFKIEDNVSAWEGILETALVQLGHLYFSKNTRFPNLGEISEAHYVDHLGIYEEGDWWALTIISVKNKSREAYHLFLPLFGAINTQPENNENVAFGIITESGSYGRREWKLLDAFTDDDFRKKLLHLFLPWDDRLNAYTEISERGTGKFSFHLKHGYDKEIRPIGKDFLRVTSSGNTLVKYENGFRLIFPQTLQRKDISILEKSDHIIGWITYSNKDLGTLVIGVLIFS